MDKGETESQKIQIVRQPCYFYAIKTEYINSLHQNIKFIFEEEHNNKIALLNITTTRVGNKLQTSFF